MSVESVRAYFRDHGLNHDVLEFDGSTETVELAAQALGVKPELIAKTLAFKLKEKGILVVAKGTARIDNRKFKSQFGMRAKMMTPDEVLEKSGHPVGGVCPFALNEDLEIYLDESLKQFKQVYPAAASGNTCIEITPEELSRVTGGTWVDLCK